MVGDIIAIGGGGFGRSLDHLRIESYLLAQLGKLDRRPRVGFLPQASCEDAAYIARFYQAFSRLNADAMHVSLFGVVHPGWQEQLLQQDLIYVGGGNTRSMLALWREWGVDELLARAHQEGILLCGVSAGAICWFEQGVTDSVWPLGALPCLGLLAGSACPHYDGEIERKPGYARLLANDAIQPGLAIDDLAAAHFRNDKLFQVLAARESASVYRVDKQGAAEATDVPRVVTVKTTVEIGVETT